MSRAVNRNDVKVGLVGARGYAGRELLSLIEGHSQLRLGFAASRHLAGRPIRDSVPTWSGHDVFTDVTPEMVADHGADVIVLALPNGLSGEYLAAIDAQTVVVDLSADHRFDDAWVYGLPELHRDDLPGAKRIANPGCYATAAMLALAPITSHLDGEPSAFGISGYSGAGTDPSPKNDPTMLRDSVMPYQLTGHIHEREITHQIGRRVRFAPSVAPFERGLVVTVLARLRQPTDVGSLAGMYKGHYRDDRLVQVENEAPLPRDAAGRFGATVGGFSVDEADRRLIGVAVALDNLLKGASSQAVQNINLAYGFENLDGLRSHA